MSICISDSLSSVTGQARQHFAEVLAGCSTAPWWTHVVITASSQHQAERFAHELGARRRQDSLPDGTYLAVADPGGHRIGSGGATLHALDRLARQVGCEEATTLEWWTAHRVLVIHSGGDARRLPQYSLSGKLFSRLPVATPWSDASTLFDELMAMTSLWCTRLTSGLVVLSGDVLPIFAVEDLDWTRPGVSGVAFRQPVDIGCQHGVYVSDDTGRVYTFLQKPTPDEILEAGGMLSNGMVATDSGILCLDSQLATVLTTQGRAIPWDDASETRSSPLPAIDLYDHMTRALTGTWCPTPSDPPALRELAKILRQQPFWCDIVDGAFLHFGTTALFRGLMTDASPFQSLYPEYGMRTPVPPRNVQCAGVLVDTVLQAGGEIAPNALLMECDLSVPVRAGRGAILHGLAGLTRPVEVPEDTVVHQVPVCLATGDIRSVIRVYDVTDDPKILLSSGRATWLGLPMLKACARLGMTEEQLWPDVSPQERSLWNARLFPLETADEAWASVLWMLGQESAYSSDRWRAGERVSLASSAQLADLDALARAQRVRTEHRWLQTLVSVAEQDGDVQPLLGFAPGIRLLSTAAEMLTTRGNLLFDTQPTKAASVCYQASRCYAQASLQQQANTAVAAAFSAVQAAVVGKEKDDRAHQLPIVRWQKHQVRVNAPVRLDFGGGWSDTPPFCLDWGGTVLNMAVTLQGETPVQVTATRLAQPIIRIIAEEHQLVSEYSDFEALTAPPDLFSPLSLPRLALQYCGLSRPGQSLSDILHDMGGGIELRLAVRLPMGSGLGTSSILASAIVTAIAQLAGISLSPEAVIAIVLHLEQQMTTGGGWQDQAGSVYPGLKLLTTRPGVPQHVHVDSILWNPQMAHEFSTRTLLFYTGIQRVAKDLLQHIMGRYLAREAMAIQALHAIKSLATEMRHALHEQAWEEFGRLLNLHWEANLTLDPHTTNAPINQLLQQTAPYLAGAKLLGAGGGGFMFLLAKDPDCRAQLEALLSSPAYGSGRLYPYAPSEAGLVCTTLQ